MNPQELELAKEYQKEVPPTIFDTEHAIKRQEFEWSLVQCHTPKEDSPMWTKEYNRSRFANAEQRLFGEGNYEFYIRTIQGISGNHQIMSMDTKGPKDFLQDKQSLESNYNPHIYLLRGQRFIWYTVLTRAQIHTNTLYICSKIDNPNDPQSCKSCTRRCS
jgi:hypothetical protein